jgi:hypothetical protein
MKSNINIRTIVDTDNNKVYLSVEGKIENGSKEEKENLRNKLVEAFSIVLGLDETPAEATVSGFVEVEEEEDKKIKELVVATMETEEETAPIADSIKEPKQEDENNLKQGPIPPEEKPEPKMRYGRYRNKLPSEVMSAEGENGISPLLYHLGSLEKNLKNYPENQEVIEAICKAIIDWKKKNGKSLTLKEMDWEIRSKSIAAGDDKMEAVNSLCAAMGETYESILKANDMDRMRYIYTNFMEV